MTDHRFVSRRTVTRGAAWTAPALTLAAAAPSLSASPVDPKCPEPSRFGELVAVPWENTWAGAKFTGTAQRYQPWAIYPTSAAILCDPSTGTTFAHSITNATPNSGVGEPLLNGQSTAFPPIYPTTGTAYNGNGSEHPDGVGKGAVITVTITAVKGGGFSSRPTYSGSTSSSSPTFGQAWPTLIPRDYRPNNPDDYYDFMVVTQGSPISGSNAEFYGTPDSSSAPASWTWQLRITNPIDNQHDGSDVVSFDIDYPVRLNMPGTPPGADPVQYRTTVTSPWGVVEYLSAAI